MRLMRDALSSLTLAAVLVMSFAPASAQVAAPQGGSPGSPVLPTQASNALSFVKIGTYTVPGTTYDVGAAEIVAYDAASQRLFSVNAQAATVDIIDLSDPYLPELVSSLTLSPTFGAAANSVAVRNGLVAVAVEAVVRQDPGRVAFFDAAGTPIYSVTVGALPDMVTFSPDGRFVLTANEGEPTSPYSTTTDPEGSISVIDISAGVTNAVVTTLGFADFNVGGPRHAELPAGVRVFCPGASVAQDLEPEYIAVAPDSATAYVTLQENNALAIVNLNTLSVTAVLALGTKDHTVPGNGFDPSRQDNVVNITTAYTVSGLYQPDAIAAYAAAGNTYLVTANEGDAREYTGCNEVRTVSTLNLDDTLFPNEAALKTVQQLGDLQVSVVTGTALAADPDNDNDIDTLYAFGARSFSIWDGANGTLVFDSGDHLERTLAEIYGRARFNISHSGNNGNRAEQRSFSKGPEPEAITVASLFGRTYAFLGLERQGGVMVYDVTNPAAPEFVSHFNNRTFPTGNVISAANYRLSNDLGPEDILIISAADSPLGVPLLVIANEISGSITVFAIYPRPQVTQQVYTFNDLDQFPLGTVALSSTLPTSVTLNLGGFSGLRLVARDASTGELTFSTHTDRGPNPAPIGDQRPFALPGFAPQWVTFTVQPATGEVTTLGTLSLTLSGGITTLTGLPNLAGVAGAPYDDEAPVDLFGAPVPLDAFGADMEGLTRANDGTLWMVDEYRPAIYHFLPTGELANRYVPIQPMTVTTDTGIQALPAVLATRRANRGFEAVAYNPDNGKLYAFVQSPLDNPDSASDNNSRGGRYIRIVEFDTTTFTTTAQYLYPIEGGFTEKIGDATYIGNGEFLVLERDDATDSNARKFIFKFSLAGASDISAIISPSVESMITADLLANAITPIRKTLFLDLTAAGYTGYDKPEGLAWLGGDMVAVINDNDFGVSDAPILLNGTIAMRDPQTAPALVTFSPARLSLLHNNDGESSLLPSTQTVVPGWGGYTNTMTQTITVGGAAAFQSVMVREMAQATSVGQAVMALYSGDAYLASATLLCSLPVTDTSQPVYDAVAQRPMPYTAHIFGNHEFDLTPDYLERFIRTFTETGSLPTQPFLSANLDFSAEPAYADLLDADGLIEGPVTDGRVIGRSMIYTDANTGLVFGIVGATTPLLPNISSPRNVSVTTDITSTAAAVQAEVDRLLARGVNRIVLSSHMQNIAADRDLIRLLNGVDIAVLGGGDDLLLSTSVPTLTQVLPGETQGVGGTYPLTEVDAMSRTVYMVTTKGNYQYLGRLDIEFDLMGEVSRIITATSYPRRVISTTTSATGGLGLTDTVTPNATINATAITPVQQCLAAFAATDIAKVEPGANLLTTRNGVRTRETSGGNLVTDAYLWAYNQYATNASNNLPPQSFANPVIAIQNGGGIRQTGTMAGGRFPPTGVVTVTRQNTLDTLSFLTNQLTVITNVTPAEIKAIFEWSGRLLPAENGAFLQVAGITVTYNMSNTANVNRVRSVQLADGRYLVQNGAVVAGAPNVSIATNSFTAEGGDAYTMLAAKTTRLNLRDNLGVFLTYEDALVNYLRENTAFPLGGDGLRTITGTQYANDFGVGRIVRLGAAYDLAVDQTAPALVTTGQPFTYTYTITHTGATPATSVVLTNTLPAGVTFDSASAGCVLNLSEVVCALGTLSNASTTLTVTITPNSSGTLTNTITAFGNPLDNDELDTTNNTSTATTEAQPASYRIYLPILQR